MTTIPAQAVTNYRNAIEQCASSAAKYVTDSLTTGMTAAQAADAGRTALLDAISAYGDNAQVLSNMMFDEIMDVIGRSATAEFYDSVLDYDVINKKVNYYIKQYLSEMSEESFEMFRKRMGNLAATNTRRSANESMIGNCRDNKMGRVILAQPNACTFCLAQASRGVISWKSKKKDNFFHENCNCVAMPATDVRYKGHSQQEYLDKYYEAKAEDNERHARWVEKRQAAAAKRGEEW